MTERKGDTKRQHYVPRMILRNFSKDGRRISLLVRGKRIDRASLRDQCYADYFYGEDNVLEKSFASEEEKLAAFFRDLSLERLTALPPERIDQLRYFVAYQRGRTQGAAEHLSTAVDAVISRRMGEVHVHLVNHSVPRVEDILHPRRLDRQGIGIMPNVRCSELRGSPVDANVCPPLTG